MVVLDAEVFGCSQGVRPQRCRGRQERAVLRPHRFAAHAQRLERCCAQRNTPRHHAPRLATQLRTHLRSAHAVHRGRDDAYLVLSALRGLRSAAAARNFAAGCVCCTAMGIHRLGRRTTSPSTAHVGVHRGITLPFHPGCCASVHALQCLLRDRAFDSCASRAIVPGSPCPSCLQWCV